MASERWRLDDWMRPARGGHYSTQPMQNGVLPSGYRSGTRRRRRSWSLADVTPKDRRSMVWGLLFLVLGYATASWLWGFARATSLSGGAFVVGLVYLWRLWKSRAVGWRSVAPVQTPTAPTP